MVAMGSALTEEQRAELAATLLKVTGVFLARVEDQTLSTVEDFEAAITHALEEAYGVLAGPPVDPREVRQLARRMSELAQRHRSDT